MPQPDLSQKPNPDDLKQGLENDTAPKPDEDKTDTQGEGEKETKVPYHQDPNVQLYIERQIAKRLGEGNDGLNDRLARLEERLTTKDTGPERIGDWTPATAQEARIAKAIASQAKQDTLDALAAQEQQMTQQQQADDKAFGDWLDELKVVGKLKDEAEQKDFAKMIVEYGIEDKQKALNLWDKLREVKNQAKEEGEVDGIKKAQEAKVASGRKGTEPGEQQRSYAQRRKEEPNFDAILDRELARLGKN